MLAVIMSVAPLEAAHVRAMLVETATDRARRAARSVMCIIVCGDHLERERGHGVGKSLSEREMEGRRFDQ